MGLREEKLRCFIQNQFEVNVFCNVKKPTQKEYYDSEFNEDLIELYKYFGGKLANYPTEFKGFDIKLHNKAIELDEEQHFNRYRLQALKSSIYVKNRFDFLRNYKVYCEKYESDCLLKASNRKYWTNESSEKQYGQSDKPGEFDKHGSARWKQRAFYDVLREVLNKITGYKVIRLSIYDKIRIHNQELELKIILDNILNKEYQDGLKKKMEKYI